jgi:hypothetical protein
MITSMAERRSQDRRRFNILEYQAPVQDAIVLAQQAAPVIAALERIIDSPGFEKNLPAVVAAANELEEEVISQVVDRLFLRGLLLILVFFLGLVGYSWIAGRIWRSGAPARTTGA